MVTMIVIALISLFVALFFVAPSGDAKDDTRLMHAQGGWVQLAIAAVGAYAQSRENRRNQQAQQGMTMEQIQEQGSQNRQTSAFEAALADYYGQQANDRARRSLANFSRWSTVPQGEQPYYTPDVPTMPNPNDYGGKPTPNTGRRP